MDERNLRFIVPPNPSQQSIIKYLIENEEVEQLADDIAKRGGLYAGERCSGSIVEIFFELSLKYYMERVNESNKIDEGHLEGTYVSALESMRVKKLLKSVEHSNLLQLKKKDIIFNIFNGYVHYDSVVQNKDVLIFYFDNLR